MYGVEVQLGVERPLEVLRAPKAMLLTGEQEVADRDSPGAQRRHHQLSLIRRHDGVLFALEEDHGRDEPINEMDRRALPIALDLARVRADQPVQVMGLELVSIPSERLEVADT